jgi:hypothetical protein
VQIKKEIIKVASQLSTWQPFYVIVGTASATLTGLMFVVITLIAGLQEGRSGGAVRTFTTPSLIHFCAVILISALISAPWPYLWQLSLLFGIMGLAGALYVFLVIRRLYNLSNDFYQPVMEDWFFHALLPCIAYTGILVAAILLPHYTVLALFSIAAIALLFLFIGIHNAWDTVTYIVIERNNQQQE